MTTKEHDRLQQFVNSLTKLNEEKDAAFKDLQVLSKALTGTAWCSAEQNYKKIIKRERSNNGEYYTMRASEDYRKYLESCGKIEAIRDLMGVLSELNFWNN